LVQIIAGWGWINTATCGWNEEIVYQEEFEPDTKNGSYSVVVLMMVQLMTSAVIPLE
jgi:hypothetical protein